MSAISEPKLDLIDDPSLWESFRTHISTLIAGVRFASTWHTLFMVALSSLATFICSKGVIDFSFDTSMSIVAVGTVFPLVFSVQASFQRREKALAGLATLKGSLFALYLMSKTWEKDGSGNWAYQMDQVFQKLLDDMEYYFRHPKRSEESANVIYDGFATLAKTMNDFAPKAGFTKGGEAGMARMAAYFQEMLKSFEGVRAIRDTETPVGLRLFCFALIHIAPIVLAPYWIHFCQKEDQSAIASEYGCGASYFVSITYVLIVMTLHRVQVELEDPFDGDGDDDIKWEVWRSQIDQLGNYGEEGPVRRQEALRLLHPSRPDYH